MNTIQNMMGTLQGIQVNHHLWDFDFETVTITMSTNITTIMTTTLYPNQPQSPPSALMEDLLKLFKVRAEAYVTDFFYNNTQKGWCETRIINNTLDLRLVCWCWWFWRWWWWWWWWCETRIINNTLDLRLEWWWYHVLKPTMVNITIPIIFSFVGRQPLVFKPGMPFEAQIAVRYSDQVPAKSSKVTFK